MVSNLQAGDVLLYGPIGVFGWVISVKTWHKIAHCEIYWGEGKSAASRDGLGVDLYPMRTSELIYVLRPAKFNKDLATPYVEATLGTPYGWWDLLNFIGADLDARGIICSTFVTNVLRAGGVSVFNRENANDIAPFQFLTSELLTEVDFSS